MKLFKTLNDEKIKPYLLGVTFLLIEAIAFLTFSLGNSVLAYTIIGVVLLLLFLIISINKINKDGLFNLAFFAFPLLLFGIVLAIGNFGRVELSPLYNVCLPISLLAFSSIGYFVSLHKELKLMTVFTVIYSTLAVLTLINMIATWIQFTPFHSYFTSEYYMYFSGNKSEIPLSEMAYGLSGFSLEVMTIEFISIFPSLLLSSVIGLFFISPKNNLKLFLAYCAFTFIAALSLISINGPRVLLAVALIVLVLALVVLTAKGVIKEKAVKILIKVGVALAIILFIIIFLNGQTQWSFLDGFRSMIANNKLLNGVFNVLFGKMSAATQDIFGIHILGHIFGNPKVEPLLTPLDNFSNSWLFDLFTCGGLFGFVAFMFVFVISMKALYNFAKLSSRPSEEKSLLVGFLFAYFVFTMFDGVGMPLVFYKNIYPIYHSGPFFVVIFLLSYVYNSSYRFILKKKESNKEEQVNA